MPRYSPVNILGGCYSDENRSWSLQDTVNWLPAQSEQPDTRTATQFKTPPGLRPFLEIPATGGGEDPLIPSKPVRGLYNCEGKLFSAIGKTLYQITNSGVAIPQGTIPGNTRVTMTHNQISQGNELVAVNGSSGYVYNTLTQTFQKITDDGFPGAIWVGFADGYILGIEPGRRFAFNSDSADALNYNTLDRFTSEYKPDLIVTGVINNNELILLNETSYEFFENTGATQQPFRSKRIFGDVGCGSRFGAINLDRTVFMFGADGKFYRLDGYNWVRISTRPIEQAVRGLNWSQCFASVWDDSGHSVVYWTFPDGLTWGFDQSTQLWHRRKSLGLDRWRVNCTAELNGTWYAGDFQTGRIWQLDWDYILEGDQEIESERVTGVLADNQNLLVIPRVELLFNTGQEETIPVSFPVQPDPPTISGEAPDGQSGDAYSFSYTTTPGTAPIARTVLIGGALPAGWSWSESTATISHPSTPVPSVALTLKMRVYDTNGLWAELDDSFQIASPLWLGTVPGSLAAVRPLYDTLDWSVGGNIDVSAVPSTVVRGGARYGDKMYLAILSGSDSDLAFSGLDDLIDWQEGLALPVTGGRVRIGTSGARLFNWGQSSSSVHWIDSPTDPSWSSIALTGGFTSNNIEQFCGDGVRAVCANGYGTLWGSNDNGNTFTKGAELFGADAFYTFQCMMDCNNGRFIIGGRDSVAGGGAYYTDDLGATATRCLFPAGVRAAQPQQVKYCGDSRWLMAFSGAGGSTDSGLYLSSDNGVSFSPVDMPVDLYFAQEWGQSIAMESQTGAVVVAGLEVGSGQPRFYSSADFVSWTELDLSDTAANGITELYPLGLTP